MKYRSLLLINAIGSKYINGSISNNNKLLANLSNIVLENSK